MAANFLAEPTPLPDNVPVSRLQRGGFHAHHCCLPILRLLAARCLTKDLPMIRFACPTCRKVLNASDDKAGRKAPCPACGQRLLVPRPIHVPAQIQNKTVLGQPLPAVAEPSGSTVKPLTVDERPIRWWWSESSFVTALAILAGLGLLVVGVNRYREIKFLEDFWRTVIRHIEKFKQ
jgi:DNA-directed RNA polymerase subunit RPC12/RpoP